MSEDEGADAGPDDAVTMVVERTPRPGATEALEAAIRALIAAALAFPGHLGVTVARPSPPAQPGFRIVYRFDSRAHLEAWRSSETFRRLTIEADRFTEGGAHEEALTGLEVWFTAPGAPPPRRTKVAVVTWLGIFPLVYLSSLALQALAPGAGLLLRVALVTALVAVAMTFFVAPLLMRLFKPWLTAKPASNRPR
jgi:antibiotic biosynthesis monooxygenase (ABM) superfamily enzyme